MRLTIVYDNSSVNPKLKSNWGFSAFIEAHNRTILFDTGSYGNILMSNLHDLSISPETIDDVVISHPHYDHVGGLKTLLFRTSIATIWIPPSFEDMAPAGENYRILDHPQKMYTGIYSTGQLENIEQALCIETSKGIVIVVGCSHPRMETIIESAANFGTPYALIGGLHGTMPDGVMNLKLICPTHCTQHKSAIEALFPDKYVEGGAGKIIEIN